MTKINFFGLVATVMLLSAFSISSSTTWNIAEGHSIAFSSKDPSGIFTELSGDIEFNGDDLASSKFDVKINVASINTGNGMKNKHAKSEKWFDAETYPTINFTSQSFAKTDAGYTVTGTLEMHGVKKEMTLPFTFKDQVFSSSFSVSRLEFGVGTMKGMSKKVPDEIKLDISVPVTN